MNQSLNPGFVLAVHHISRALQLSTRHAALSAQAAKLTTLAERERQIIALAAKGVPNKTIAVRLGISIKTVEENRLKAYSKLSVAITAEMTSLVTFGRFFMSFAE
jgi:two-component system response regulator FixJ